MSNQTRFLFFSILSIAFMIEKTYQLGVWYRENLHSTVVEYSKKGFALLITIAILAGEGAEYLYNNRTEYYEKLKQYMIKLNQYRNKLGSYFVYDTVALA